jgi:putative DNA primase/helicase
MTRKEKSQGAIPGNQIKNQQNNSTTNSDIKPIFEAHRLFKSLVKPESLKAKFEELTKQGWRIVDIIPDDAGFIVIYGKQKSFKSFLALDMALSIANGVDYHGKETEQGTVLYIAGEGQKGVLKRVEAWRQIKKLDSIENFYLMIKPVIISEPDSYKDLISLIELFPTKPAIVFIDTIARSMKGDENGAGMAEFIAGCDEIQANTGVQIVAIHHTPKNGDTMRGWSGLGGAIDFSYLVEKDNKRPMTAILKADDVKDHSDKGQFFFDMVLHDTGSEDTSGQAITSLVPSLNTELSPEPSYNKSRTLRGKKLVLFNALKAVIKDSLEDTASLEEWRNAYYKKDTSNSKYVTFSREHEKLIQDGYVFESGGCFFIPEENQ